MALAKIEAIEDRIFQGIAVVGLTTTSLAKSAPFIQRTSGQVGFANLEKHGLAVGLIRGFNECRQEPATDTSAL